jgi:hypothetical protein
MKNAELEVTDWYLAGICDNDREKVIPFRRNGGICGKWGMPAYSLNFQQVLIKMGNMCDISCRNIVERWKNMQINVR